MDSSDLESTEYNDQKKRGFWLTAFLVLMFVANPLTAITYIFRADAILPAFPGMGVGLVYFLGALAVVNFILAIGIWNWKKWGVYGFYISVVIAFAINIYIGLGIAASAMGLLGAVLVFFTSKKRWPYFS